MKYVSTLLSAGVLVALFALRLQSIDRPEREALAYAERQGWRPLEANCLLPNRRKGGALCVVPIYDGRLKILRCGTGALGERRGCREERLMYHPYDNDTGPRRAPAYYERGAR